MTKIEVLKALIRVQSVLWDIRHGQTYTDEQIKQVSNDISKVREKFCELPNDEVKL